MAYLDLTYSEIKLVRKICSVYIEYFKQENWDTIDEDFRKEIEDIGGTENDLKGADKFLIFFLEEIYEDPDSMMDMDDELLLIFRDMCLRNYDMEEYQDEKESLLLKIKLKTEGLSPQ